MARVLTAEGIPTPMGKSAGWLRSSILIMLRNPVYVGQAVAYRHEKVMAQGRNRAIGQRGQVEHQRERPHSEWVNIPGLVIPTLVDQETFDRAQAQVARNKVESPRRHKDPEAFLLRSGHARCGYCGHALAAKAHRGTGGRAAANIYCCSDTNRDQHGCPHFTISARLLDTAVWDRILMVLAHPDYVRENIEALLGQDTTDEELQVNDRHLKEVINQQQNLTQRLALVDDDSAKLVIAELGQLADQ